MDGKKFQIKVRRNRKSRLRKYWKLSIDDLMTLLTAKERLRVYISPSLFGVENKFPMLLITL